MQRHPILLADSECPPGPEHSLLSQLPKPSARTVHSALAAQKSPHDPATAPAWLVLASRAGAPCESAPYLLPDGAPPPPQRLARAVAVPRAPALRYSWLRPRRAPP